MTETPARYVPEKRQYEKKDWLYEQYWGELLSATEVAEKVDVERRTILRKLRDKGIPRRPIRYRPETPTSPFTGFYNGDENAQVTGDEVNTASYDQEKAQESKLMWGDMMAGEG